VTLQLQWVTQAQFAGYYVALENGYYEEEEPRRDDQAGRPDIAPPQVLAGGGADVIVELDAAALAARERGLPLVNIAQPFKRSGMMLTCRRYRHHRARGPSGKTLGVWFFGNEYPFLSWMSQLGIPTEGGENGVTVLQQGFNVDPLLQRQADCISTMTYNEYWQVIDAGISARRTGDLQIRGPGRRDAGGRALRARREPRGPGLRRQDDPLRARLDAGLEMGRGEPRRGGDDRARLRRDRRPDRGAPDPHDGRGRQADRRIERHA
jgi:hypothetical protein